jgi:signal transduction histidine kinase
MNIFLKLNLLFFLISWPLQSQKINPIELLNNEMVNTSDRFKSEIFFKKSVSFFLQKKWDSVLVYSQKHLGTSQTNRLDDFSHFLRGYSFKKKHIFIEAEKEFNLIAINFKFYNLTITNLGALALEQRQFKKAITYFKKVENLEEKEYNFILKSSVINNLGLCYLHLKKFKEAEPYFIKSLSLQEKEKDTTKIIGAYMNMASFYYDQYKDKFAIPYFKKAYFLAKNTNNFGLKRKTAKNMAVVEENRKNYKKALGYRKEYGQWKDSLNDQNKIYEVAQLEKEFAVKEKQKEVTLLEAENKIKEAERNTLLYSAIVLILLLGAGGYFYREKVKSNQIITAQKESLNELNATKDKLFSIVSHDLRSSVNALKTSNTSLIDNLDSNNLEALRNLLQNNSAIVNGAYVLLDNLLHWALSQTKQGYFEITATRLSFIVEQMAYNYTPLMLEKNIQFENKVLKKDLVYVDQESLKLVIRNLLDNAIKFSNTNGKIKVYTTNKQDDYCDLIIEDTGMGMSNNARLKLLKDTLLLSKKENKEIIGTGLGLQLCKTMLKKNNGKFFIESSVGIGTKMIVSLPKKQANG